MVLVALAMVVSVMGPAAAALTGDEQAAQDGADEVASGTPAATADPATIHLQQDDGNDTLDNETERAAEDAVDEAIETLQRQGVTVNQTQRAAAVNGTLSAVEQYQNATAEQVQNATLGAVTGAFLQSQNVSVEQVQNATAGAAAGALSQRQDANVTQLQHAAFGSAHGAVAQAQNVTIEQIQYVAQGAAAGAANASDEETKPGAIREAAQGAAFGALAEQGNATVEQRQNVTVEQRQHAAVGAAAGALTGNHSASVKQIQVAAIGAAKGALSVSQEQDVTVEQVQHAARGACAGALKQAQRVSVTQIQEAALGAARGAITQSQSASVTQIQAAADGAAEGALVQRQTVTVTQVQYAAAGAAEGAVTSAVQEQIVRIELIQAAARGAGEGAVTQIQTIDIVQIQRLATAGSGGALQGAAQVQNVDVTQVQYAATGATESGVEASQTQRIDVEQLQTIVRESAGGTVVIAVEEGLQESDEIADRSTDAVENQTTEDEDEAPDEAPDDEAPDDEAEPDNETDEQRPEATVEFDDQETAGENVTVASADLSAGGYLAVYEIEDWATRTADPLGVSAPLDPGEQTDVTVDLDEPLTENATLVAVPYRDADGDESFEYDLADGGDDAPYRTEAGTVVRDAAEVTILEDEPEPTATLAVENQSGNGSELLIENASATVEYVVEADYDAGTTTTDAFGPDETLDNETIALDPPIEDDGPVEVTVRAADTDDALANETVAYDVDEPFANVTIENQTVEGTTVEVASANLSEGGFVALHENATNGTDDVLGLSGYFDPGEYEDFQIGLDEPLAENTTVNATVHRDTNDNETFDFAATGGADDEPFVNETGAPVADGALLSVEPEVEPDVEFLNCSAVRIDGEFDRLDVALDYYTESGNATDERVLTAADVPGERPVDGSTLVTIGETEETYEREDGTLVVQFADPGAFGDEVGSFVATVNASGAEEDLNASQPNATECREAIQPESPVLGVESVEVEDNETALVNLTVENPNAAALTPDYSEITNGTVADAPPATFEPGDQFAVVEWTPESDDERVVWTANFTSFDLPNATATGPTAAEVDGLLEPPNETVEPDENETGANETDEFDGNETGANETDETDLNETDENETVAPIENETDGADNETGTPDATPDGIDENETAMNATGDNEANGVDADEPTATEEPTPTPTEEATPTPTDEPTPTPTEEPTPTEGPTPTPTEEPTPTPTDEPTPTEEATPTPTEEPTPTPTEEPATNTTGNGNDEPTAIGEVLPIDPLLRGVFGR